MKREMQQPISTKVILLYLLLLPILFNRSLSDVHFTQEAAGKNAASNGKETWDDVDTQKGDKKLGLGGRKMGSVVNFMKGHGPNDERASKVSSATRRKQSNRNLLSKDEDLAAGFEAFNADYKGPRRHPPKNN